MRLHYMKTMNPRKACVVAKYLNSPVEYVPIDFTAGGLRSADYLALNPNARAPVLEDGGKTIWESVAIMVHLAVKAGSDLWPAHDPARQVDVLRWISWDAFHFAPHAAAFYFEHVIKPRLGLGEPNQAALEAKLPFLHRSAKVLDQELSSRAFLAGEKLTIADFCTAILLPMADEIGLPLSEYSNIWRWHDRLMKIEAWQDPWPT